MEDRTISGGDGQDMEDPACQEAMANLNLIPAYLDYKDFAEDLYRMRDVYAEIVPLLIPQHPNRADICCPVLPFLYRGIVRSPAG